MNYCFANDLIPDEQFGFLPKRPTDWQLLHLLADWHAALNAGQDIHALFVDISKAFDQVDHGLLQVKLEALGVRGVELNWFTSYLENRHICTVVSDAPSTLLPTSSGVPQGSIFDPLLFVIYFRD